MAQVREIDLSRDDRVLEKLAPRLSKAESRSPQQQLAAVRQAIKLARQNSDPRYLGQAQALLGTAWGNSQSSHEQLTLQATIEQSRHEFEAARKTLALALTKPSGSTAQAWLTLATIERVQGRYSEAAKACNNIQESTAQFYARVCQLETLSLQGQDQIVVQSFEQLLKQTVDRSLQAWLYSLLAEHELRGGNLGAAFAHFSKSLALDADGYTALAYADALLAQQQAPQALAVLQSQPDSDSVLIRRAQALVLLKEPRSHELNSLMLEIEQRFSSAALRGEWTGHARERALYALRVQGRVKEALQWARQNLQTQRESIDWLLALQSAELAGDASQKSKLLQALRISGLKDARLQR